MKIYIDLIKNFSKSVDVLFLKIDEFQCRISNVDDILFAPRFYDKGAFLQHGKSHALNVRSDSTPRMLTLSEAKSEMKISDCEKCIAQVRNNDMIYFDH